MFQRQRGRCSRPLPSLRQCTCVSATERKVLQAAAITQTVYLCFRDREEGVAGRCHHSDSVLVFQRQRGRCSRPLPSLRQCICVSGTERKVLQAAAITQTVYLCFSDREEGVAGFCHHSDSVLVFQGQRGRCCRLLSSLRQCTCVSATERKVLHAAAITQTVYLCFRDREEGVAGRCHDSDNVLVFQRQRGRCCRPLPSLRQCTCVSATERKVLHAAAMTQTVYLCFRDREEGVAGRCHHSDSVLVFQRQRGRCSRPLPSLRQCTCVSATERKV